MNTENTVEQIELNDSDLEQVDGAMGNFLGYGYGYGGFISPYVGGCGLYSGFISPYVGGCGLYSGYVGGFGGFGGFGGGCF
ncbi:hypothetical protein [Dictyobacter aurantiacus]|uniref:Uncharacterized protein n=1 Tax=Dictyobacter aurantiacus TaxID=1936993 RepID=A0A401ZQE6_9CHLR|nr:hypothetical protein [Dictyobacter aurantiacus]GCE09052.1 hypothetical protein KDAU_63810 [Dictyobacter aurantiacus]